MTGPRYVYAIGRALDPDSPDSLAGLAGLTGLTGLTGVDGAEVHPVAHGDLVAVVSAAPPDEAALTARLERLDELAAVAEAHHAVVAAVATQTVVAPFRLATIYRDERRVRELLHHRYREFEALLDHLCGSVEIGVKLYVEDRSPDPPAPNGSGRAYLQQLSQKHQRRDEQWRHAMTAAELVDTALSAHAADRCHHRPQPAQLSGAAGQNIFNASYLVPTGRVTEFTELAWRLVTGEPALRVEVTGPWAPYSFTGDRA
ncbi:MAG TPA: GvpL/GvpF family gas vesicle protein [Candidatus Limnocylindrales bacterium]